MLSGELSEKLSNPKDVVGTRKVSMSVLPSGPVMEAAVGMMEGAAKYGRHNYRVAGVRSSVYYDAAMRHLMAWWEGEDTDPDSGLSHVTKAITTLIVLRDAQINSMVTDDRPPQSVPFIARLNDAAGLVLDKHADKNPKHWTRADND